MCIFLNRKVHFNMLETIIGTKGGRGEPIHAIQFSAQLIFSKLISLGFPFSLSLKKADERSECKNSSSASMQYMMTQEQISIYETIFVAADSQHTFFLCPDGCVGISQLARFNGTRISKTGGWGIVQEALVDIWEIKKWEVRKKSRAPTP